MTRHDDHVVGIDLGGTNIRARCFEGGRPGRTRTRSSRLSNAEAGRPAGVLLELLDSVCGDRDSVDAVGVAVTGPVERANGLVDNPFTLPQWSGLPWKADLEAELGVPVIVENDAVSAAIGELSHGAAVDADVLCMVTLGTGIGVAVVSASQGPYRGTGGFHPEAGHIAIGGSDAVCYCGETGCWEEQCSGAGIRRYWTLADDRVDWPSYGKTLARGLRILSRVFAPDRILLGGGIAANYDDFEAAATRALTTADPIGSPPPVVSKAMLDDAGVYGAARLARDAMNSAKRGKDT